MCDKYGVCGKRHYKVSKYRRDRKGRFDKDRRLVKLFIISFGIYAVSMLGVNTIWGWAKSLEKTIVVEQSLAEEIIEWPTLEDKVYKVAKEYGISGYQMWRTIECETDFRNIQSEVIKNGKRELSFGYAQIHLPDWPEVSRSEALNEDFAIRWMAEHWYMAKWFAYNRKTDRCIK